jgi:hypothetical protein
MQSGALATRTDNQKRIPKQNTSQNQQRVSKTKHITKSAASFQNKTHYRTSNALVFRIHVSFSCNQQLTRYTVTIKGSDMQSGGLVTKRDNQKRISKTKHITKSVTDFKHKCAPVCRIHVSFPCNKQLTHFSGNITGSFMQSGALKTRAKNQKRIKNTEHNTKSVKKFKHEYQPVCRIHVSFPCNQQLACFRATITGSDMQSGAKATKAKNKKRIENRAQHKISNKFQT